MRERKIFRETSMPGLILKFFIKDSHLAKLSDSMELSIPHLWRMEQLNSSKRRNYQLRNNHCSDHLKRVIQLTLGIIKLLVATAEALNTLMLRNVRKIPWCTESIQPRKFGVQLPKWARVWWPKALQTTSVMLVWRDQW